MKRYSSVVLLANMAAPSALALVGGRSSAISRSVARSNSRLPRRGGYATAASSPPGDASTSNLILPELCVFDLDMCLWSPEMYELSQVPTKADAIVGPLGAAGDPNVPQGVRSVKSGSMDEIRLFPHALTVLQEVHAGKYPGMRLAAASSANSPLAVKIGRAAMQILEVVPGVTVEEVMRGNGLFSLFNAGILCKVFLAGWTDDKCLQVGRTPPLSREKWATHFPRLREFTGIAYDRMLYFDDSNWDDHCTLVAKNCPGVISQRTPHGLTARDWELGLKKYHDARSAMQ